MSYQFLDTDGLAILWNRAKTVFVKQETGRGLSTNDFTNDEKDQLASLVEGNGSVSWENVTGKPNLYNRTEIDTLLSTIQPNVERISEDTILQIVEGTYGNEE